MRVIMEQLKEEIENLKRKISMKNSTIKSLKEDFADAKKEVKDAEKKYEHECRLVQSMKNEIKTLESRQEAAATEASPSGNKKPKQEDKRVGQGSLKDGKGCSIQSTSEIFFKTCYKPREVRNTPAVRNAVF